MVGTYGYIGWAGWGFVGKPGVSLPKGAYKLKLINQASGSGTVADVALTFYWASEKGTVTAA